MSNAFKYGGVDFTKEQFAEAKKNDPKKYQEMEAQIAAWEAKYPNHAKGDHSKIMDNPPDANKKNDKEKNPNDEKSSPNSVSSLKNKMDANRGR